MYYCDKLCMRITDEQDLQMEETGKSYSPGLKISKCQQGLDR